MAEKKKEGLLPEGGEMLVLAIVMFFAFVGTVALVYTLAPGP